MGLMVIIPTYNEAENIRPLVEAILRLGLELEILIVDDDSPDGTGRIAIELSSRNPKVHVLIRKEKRGRGLSAKEAFKYALNRKAEIILEMDADFSHDPGQIPRFLEEINGWDMVIGSRYIEGGRQLNREFFRKVISKCANFYVRSILNLKFKDCTSGFRCYKQKVLNSGILDNLSCKGPSILIELLYKCEKRGFNIKEIPITFEDRRRGRSKLGIKALSECLLTGLRLRLLNS